MLAICLYQSLRRGSTFCSCTSRNIIPSFISYYSFFLVYGSLWRPAHISLSSSLPASFSASLLLFLHSFLLFSFFSSLSDAIFLPPLIVSSLFPSCVRCIVYYLRFSFRQSSSFVPLSLSLCRYFDHKVLRKNICYIMYCGVTLSVSQYSQHFRYYKKFRS